MGDISLSEKLPIPDQVDEHSNELLGTDFETDNLQSKSSTGTADTHACVENAIRPDSIHRLRLDPRATPRLAARFPHYNRPPE